MRTLNSAGDSVSLEPSIEGSGSGMLQTVARALAVLQCFTPEEPELSAAQLSDRVKLARPTVYRLLATMENLGLVERIQDSRRFRLGLEIITLANIALNQIDVRRQAMSVCQQLRDDLRLGATLSMLYRGKTLILEHLPHPDRPAMFSLVGRLHPPHATAGGKVLLAGLSTAQVRDILGSDELRAYGPNTLIKLEDLLTDLRRIRERGYAVDDEEWNPRWRCIGAPIHDRSSRVVAALSIGGPDTEIRPDTIRTLARKLIDAASRVSYKLGYPHVHY